ncbi:ATP-binding protein [Amycolatopsis sp. NPDC051102]|uniref:ATP-binding protein n=1 Tax=Amycolatopsis sp. NPDC051102 TaxID=3155163 RepID=UPI00342BD2C9
MAGDLEFAEPVRRWLRVRSGEDQDDPPFELDDGGFLPDPTADEPLRMGTGMVRPEDAVVGRGALVLLGEPGAGKTTTFARLTDADRSAGEPEPGSPGTVWITGSELGDSSSFNEVLGEHLAALPVAGAAGPLTATLTIVLDQLDEAANLFRLPARLKRALNDKDTRALRFLIACRTADYPEGLTRVLEQALGACVVADLAPLTRDDVATLAASTDVDATAFVDAVVAAGVGTLSNTPSTLKVLLAAFRQEADALSRTPRELFEAGLRLRDWLEAHRWPEDEVDDLVLAVSEAVSNSIEHGYGVPVDSALLPHPGQIEVTAAVKQSAVGPRHTELTIRDAETWREPGRGRFHAGTGWT